MEPQRQPFCTRSRAIWKTLVDGGGCSLRANSTAILWRVGALHPASVRYLLRMRWRISMSCKTEELSIDLLERVLAKLGLSSRPAPTLDGLKRSMLRGVGKCRSIMYASSSIYTITILVLCPETTPRISSKPGSPTGPGPRAGPAMALCTPCSCRLAFRVSWDGYHARCSTYTPEPWHCARRL